MKKLLQLLSLLILCVNLGPAQLRRNLIEVYPNVADSTTGSIRFEELRANGTNYVGLKAPDSIASNITWTLPNADSSGTQCLSSNGSAVLGWSACSGGSSPPFVDTTSIVEGSADGSKEVRIEADGISASTVRVWTAQNANITVAGIDLAQTWTAQQTFRAIGPSADSTYTNGSYSLAWQQTNTDHLYIPGPHASEAVAHLYEDTGGGLLALLDDDTADTPETIALIGADSSSNGYVELFVGDGAAAGLSLAYLGSTSGDGMLRLYESAATGNVQFSADGTEPDLLLTMTAGADVIPATANSHNMGDSGNEWLYMYANEYRISSAAGTCRLFNGSGIPVGACTTCDVVLNTAGGSGTTMYVCESSAWVAK